MGWFELIYIVYACVAFKVLLDKAGEGRCRRDCNRRKA